MYKKKLTPKLTWAKLQKRAKYGNKRIFDPMHGNFDSRLEYHVYLYLLRLQEKGEIHDLKRQVVIELIPSCAFYKYKKAKVKLTVKKHQLRPMRYIADFTFVDKEGEYHVCDAKGKKTKEYNIKKKILLSLQGIYIEEWTARDDSGFVFDVNMGYDSKRDPTKTPWMPPSSVRQI